MLKSLFSGVSGLQSHQIAMDVESNNIANVNTVGFKYSRANFSDLLAQTNQIATAPQGQLGGKNAVQIGLGASVASITRIHTQGSIQNTDKNTDLAIQGDGFFIVSSDNGNTYKYTRSGDFKFDANGNFVDNNGFIAQGRLRDPITGNIEATSSIQNIIIPPGLTTPAEATSEVVIKANLNAGPVVQNFSKAYAVPSGPVAAPNTATQPANDENGVPIASGDFNVLTNGIGQAFNMQEGQGVWIGFKESTVTSEIGSGGIAGGVTALNLLFRLDDGSTVPITASQGDLLATPEDNAALYVAAINAETSTTGVTAIIDTVTSPGEVLIKFTNDNSDTNASHNIDFDILAGDSSGLTTAALPVTFTSETAYQYLYSKTSTLLEGYDSVTVPAPVPNGSQIKRFNTLAELREAMENQIAVDVSGNLNTVTIPGSTGTPQVIVNDKGQLEISNDTTAAVVGDLNIKVTAFTDPTTTENIFFTQNMESLNSIIPGGSASITASEDFNAPSHATSIDIFDSLGVKWTMRVEYRKTGLTDSNGSTWSMRIVVPEPAEISDARPNPLPSNDLYGEVTFNEFGALVSRSPQEVYFTGHNGSNPNQTIALELGTPTQFDGMTSFDSVSSTSGINQDGFTGGDILGIRIDQSGTLIGSFSNGRSFGLAQMTMAKFANNEGLLADGGNIYLQSSNSGEPILGEAATAGRGFIQAAALEASNVDLSRSLTQLIIIKRGYQANGKTITTSDSLLETLIGLKR